MFQRGGTGSAGRPFGSHLQGGLGGLRGFGRHLLCALFAFLPSAVARGEELVLKNGVTVRGVPGKISTVGNGVLSQLGDDTGDAKPIYVVDDGLRRTYFSKYQLENFRPDVEFLEQIKIKPFPGVAQSTKSIGMIAMAPWPPSPFDEWGRRTYPILTPKGRIDVDQGVTRINPIYTSLQSLQTENAIVWDMRLATSSIPLPTLRRILGKHLNMEDLDDRLRLVRLLLQSTRYPEAEEELREVIAKFPEQEPLKEQLREIARLGARQKLDEVLLRREAGQHRLVRDLVAQLLATDLPAEIAGEAQEIAEDYAKQEREAKQVLDFLHEFATTGEPGPLREEAIKFRDEVRIAISPNSLPRFAEYLRLSQVEGTTPESQFALALSGWITRGIASDNLEIALSLANVRRLTRKYLISESLAEREQIVTNLQSAAGATPENLAGILAGLLPPLYELPATSTPDAKASSPDAKPSSDAREVPNAAQSPVAAPPQDAPVRTEAEAVADGTAPPGSPGGPQGESVESIPGLDAISIPGIAPKENFEYVVQLPPEYDPHRRYPVILTLHGGTSNPKMQIDWWAGPYDPQLKMRLGQASRHGFIVIAPAWIPPETTRYDYSGRAHAKVLYALRDALQRYSIDTDRVFLTGYLQGGDAAWDIGLAHPDLWAGVIPVQAIADQGQVDSPRYLAQCWRNAKMVPLYFLHGDKDGHKVLKNANEFDRYLSTDGFDAMVVEYRGRGEEHFSDEIHRLFAWMKSHTRPPTLSRFEVGSRRPWDNFFWFVEAEGLPPRAMIAPEAWPAPDAALPAPFKAVVRDRSAVTVQVKAERVAVYLGPEFVDFASGVSVTVNGRELEKNCQPQIGVMLEDARTRRDRLHPFWALQRWDRQRTDRADSSARTR